MKLQGRFNYNSVPLDAFISEQFPQLKSNAESTRDLKRLQSHHSFKAFMQAHGKDYADFAEYQLRFAIFKENMVKVQFLRETERGTGKYGATKFADLTQEEFKERHLGLYPARYNPVRNAFDSQLPDAEIPEIALPKEFDWRAQGAVTPVKNQGNPISKEFDWKRSIEIVRLKAFDCKHSIESVRLKAFNWNQLKAFD